MSNVFKKIVIGLFLGLILAAPTFASTYYISPSGSNGAAGNSGAPWKTFAYAMASARLMPGDTLYLKNGTYSNAAGTGVPSINCSSGYNDGTAGNYITIQAENERQALIQGPGNGDTFYMINCSYWKIIGLDIRSVDNAGGAGEVFLITASDHLEVKRSIFSYTNRTGGSGNNGSFIFVGSSNSLIEENEMYNFHRNGFTLKDASNSNIVRRNYCNGRAYGGDTCVTIYPGKDNIIENNISEENGSGFDIEADTPGCINNDCTIRNKFYGNISLNDNQCFFAQARGAALVYMPQDTEVYDQVCVGNHVSYASVQLHANKNTQFIGLSIFETGTGTYGTNADKPAAPYNGNDSPYVYLYNVLVTGVKSMADIFFTGQADFVCDYCAAVGTFDPPVGNVHITNPFLSAPTNLNSCYVSIPTSSNLHTAGYGGADIGANAVYKTENGVLTTSPLWPGDAFPVGATVAGLNDVVGDSAFDVGPRLHINTGGCTLAATSDPTPGNGGALSTGSITNTSLNLTWTKGTDDVSAAIALVYHIYYSLSNNITTVADAEANGTEYDYNTDINGESISGLTPSTTYYFNVVLVDEAGNKAAYDGTSAATLGGGVTYYVSKSGSDSNSCTTSKSGSAYNSANAKLTVTSALTCYAAGDTIKVWRGTYYERLTVPTSGTSGSRVTITGELDSNGQWLTIIDGSDAVVGTWTAATNNGLTGTGTYRIAETTYVGPLTGFTLDPCSLTADGKDIWPINYDMMSGVADSNYTGKTGFQLLAASSGFTLTSPNTGDSVNFWDGVEAVFATSSGFTYVRYRNGDNPNSKTIRQAPWSYRCDENNLDFGVFTVSAKNYITISNFQIQGAPVGVLITSASTAVTVDYNDIQVPGPGIQNQSGPVSTTVSNNLLHSDMVGASSGQGLAFSYGTTFSAARTIASNIYNVDKYIADRNQSTFSNGALNYVTTGFTMSGNTINDVSNALNTNVFSGSVTVSGNTIHNIFGSCVYWGDPQASSTLTIATNLLYECGNIPLRTNGMQSAPASFTLYIYGNKLYNPITSGGVGIGLQLSIGTATVVTSPVYIYHNTIVGGYHGFLREGDGGSGLPNTLFVNNLVQLTANDPSHIVYFGSTAGDFCSNAARLGDWDYNWTFGQEDACAWVQSHNVEATAITITDTSLPTNWTVPAGSTARNAGIDIAHTFTVNSIMYGALPGFSPGYFRGSAPDIGAVQTGNGCRGSILLLGAGGC